MTAAHARSRDTVDAGMPPDRARRLAAACDAADGAPLDWIQYRAEPPALGEPDPHNARMVIVGPGHSQGPTLLTETFDLGCVRDFCIDKRGEGRSVTIYWRTFHTFCGDSPCCAELCCSVTASCGVAATSATGRLPERLEAERTPVVLARPNSRPSSRCGREVVVWDVWCEESFDGIWHLEGICGHTPTPHLVWEHCLKCERVRVSHWCSECVCAYRHEQEQQLNCADGKYLWCYGCQQFVSSRWIGK